MVFQMLLEQNILEKAVGTMPHALILVLGDNRKAFKKFDEIVDSKIPRICLIDTSGSPITELEDASKCLVID